jgi:dihydrofolate synthase/folylpolyglutamate synthase
MHDAYINLSLDRILAVAHNFIPLSFECPVVIIAGTNGKGTTVAVLSALAQAAGLKVAAYTSPHLYRFNERIKINEKEISDETLNEISTFVEKTKGDVELTFFEVTTLIALYYFHQEKPDLIILEVGMGGRLDATNIIDTDISIITSIGIDHTAYLGDTKEKIAYEKAGIMRQGKPVICGELPLQDFLKSQADTVEAEFYGLGTDFQCLEGLKTTLVSSNIACAVKAAELLNLPIDRSVIEAVSIPGRKQHLSIQNKTVILDVAHNEDSLNELIRYLISLDLPGIHLVMGVMGDKDLGEALNRLAGLCKTIHLAAPNTPRAMPADRLMDKIDAASQIYPSVSAAFASALAHCRSDERVVVTGSFYTLCDVNLSLTP